MTNESSQPVLPASKLDGKYSIELPPDGVPLTQVERELVLQAMERAAGTKTRAGELLGIKRDALRRRLVKYGFRDS